MKIESADRGIKITAYDGAIPFYLVSADAEFDSKHEWYRDYFLPMERYRGLDDHEDHLLAAAASFPLVERTEQPASLEAPADA